jgi:hypothetical protein
MTGKDWVVNLEAKTCQNTKTKMIVEFDKHGSVYYGKVKDMPMQLMAQWAMEGNGEQRVKKAVLEAEDIFTRAANEKELEKRNKR